MRKSFVDRLIKDGCKILGRTFDVKRIDFAKDLRDPNSCGYIKDSSQEILIDTTVHIDRQERTVIHEILHNIDENFGIGLSEKNIVRLEAGLYQVLKDNDLLKE